ncbi:MAG: SusC/RagA family TonB-linked outer membrane protein, partial [Dysgonomonas sp.]
ITSFTKIPDLADGVTYLQMANEASMNKGKTPVYSDDFIRNTANQTDPYLYPNVNWMKEIFKDHGYNQKINVNTLGGSEYAQYYVSLGYYNEGGLYNEQKDEAYDGSMKFNRFNFVSNLTMQVTKSTEVELGVQGEISDYNTPYYSASDVFSMIMQAYPTLFPTTYPDYKTPYIDNGGGVKSPYAMVYRMGTNKRNTSETKTNLTVKQNLNFILNGLSARALVAYDFYMRNDIQRTGGNPITYKATGRDDFGNLVLARTDGMSGTNEWGYNKQQWGHRQYYMEAALNYAQIFNEKHRVSGLFLYNMTDYSNVTAGTLYHSIPFKSLGIAGRGTYSFDDRYFGEVNFGYNGAENFQPGHRFGFFPSFGAAWVPSNEKFFESMKEYIQLLKFRASWGKAGNSQLENKAKGEQDQRFAWISTVGSGSSFNFNKNPTDGNVTSGIREGKLGVDVTWETSTKSNLGIDFNVWNNDLTFQIDVFKENRKNIFMQRATIPGYIGIVDAPLGNFGEINNRGFEITSDLAKKVGKVDVMFQGNFSYNNNEWINNAEAVKPYEWQNATGKSLNVRYGFVCDGFYTDEDIANTEIAKPLGLVVQAGDLKYRDLNGDGVIDAYDKGYIGAPSVPRITYGFGTTLSWNNFTLGIFFQGVSDISLTLSASAFKPFADEAAKGNLYANIVERWTTENPSQDALWPRLDYGLTTNAMNYDESTFWIKNGAYLRLKSLDLAYNIPSKLTKRYNINSMRVFMSGYNLLTFTPFDMWDVELGQDGNGMKYPNLRTIAFGFNFSF